MEKAHLKLSLSRMTFSHELARTVLLEQIYRALSLIKGYAYPK
jgi:23S rRNA (pseudouridine1915-N3)-methyltransferase